MRALRRLTEQFCFSAMHDELRVGVRQAIGLLAHSAICTKGERRCVTWRGKYARCLGVLAALVHRARNLATYSWPVAGTGWHAGIHALQMHELSGELTRENLSSSLAQGATLPSGRKCARATGCALAGKEPCRII